MQFFDVKIGSLRMNKYVTCIKLLCALDKLYLTPSMMASTSKMTCPLCSNVGHLILDFKGLIKHLSLFHAHQPGFKVPCGIAGCSRHFTNLRTYQNHMSSVHNFCTNIESGVLEQDSFLRTTTIVMMIMTLVL